MTTQARSYIQMLSFGLLFVFIFMGKLMAQEDLTAAVHVGLVYPVSSNGKQAANYTNRFSFHAISGLSKAETGVAISGVANMIKENAKGFQMAGVTNLVGGHVAGVQVAGVANVIKQQATGAQIAGVINTARQAESVQIAGVSNITAGDAKGLQLSGFLNKGENVSNQVAGFMNIAKSVKGIQLAGLINIADSSDYPIALLNFVKNGEKSISLTVDETLTGMATFRSGGKVLYGILGLGYNFKDDSKSLYAIESGLGAHIRISERFRVNAEVVNQHLMEFKGDHYAKYHIRLLPAYRMGRITMFAGPTFNYVNYTEDKGYGFMNHYIWSKQGKKDFQGIYIGAMGGLQFNL